MLYPFSIRHKTHASHFRPKSKQYMLLLLINSSAILLLIFFFTRCFDSPPIHLLSSPIQISLFIFCCSINFLVHLLLFYKFSCSSIAHHKSSPSIRLAAAHHHSPPKIRLTGLFVPVESLAQNFLVNNSFLAHNLVLANNSSGIWMRAKQVGHYFAPSGKPYPDNWIITDIIYELEGTLISRSGHLVEGNPGTSSGDETVPYHSLSWCKNWLGPKVNITRAPQSEHDGSDVQVELNVEHLHGEDIVPNMRKSPRVKYITYYEDSESIREKRTAVWEIDKANHRNIVRLPVLMRELWLQMWHDIYPDATSKFVTKAKRGPLRNEDCYWDYGKARCAWSEYCEYRYAFGDVHLGQSCRLKISSADMLLAYV